MTQTKTQNVKQNKKCFPPPSLLLTIKTVCHRIYSVTQQPTFFVLLTELSSLGATISYKFANNKIIFYVNNEFCLDRFSSIKLTTVRLKFGRDVNCTEKKKRMDTRNVFHYLNKNFSPPDFCRPLRGLHFKWLSDEHGRWSRVHVLVYFVSHLCLFCLRDQEIKRTGNMQREQQRRLWLSAEPR